jgi:hypothetical protein
LDSLCDVFKIDEKLIVKRIDTSLSVRDLWGEGEIKSFERVIICLDKKGSVIRIDKVFTDNKKFAFAYFLNGKLDIMQWNIPEENALYDSSHEITFLTSVQVREFYLSLLTLPWITMPKITKYKCGLGG